MMATFAISNLWRTNRASRARSPLEPTARSKRPSCPRNGMEDSDRGFAAFAAWPNSLGLATHAPSGPHDWPSGDRVHVAPPDRFFRAPARATWTLLAAALACALSTGCADAPDYGPAPPGTGGTGVPDDSPIVPVGPPMTGLRVSGNHIVNAAGDTVTLRGANRSGTEYQCAHGSAIFDGPATLASIQTMVGWKINALRIPLNESCWLGINGVSPASSGANYRQAIAAYVALLHRFNIIPILELHWVGPGTFLADRQQPMPDADHAPAFWADVATTFANDDGVLFELFNEPFPDRNRDSPAGWMCWRDGCTTNQAVPTGQPVPTYQATGMQALVDAIRATGSKHVLLLGGLQYSNALSQWAAYAPTDPAVNLAVAWHVYNFNACNNTRCWDDVPATLATTVPVVMTEVGENDCMGSFIEPLLQWNDAHGVGYLAWTWNVYGTCAPPPNPPSTSGGRPWALILDYVTGAPNGGYAQAFHDHLTGL
jgi:endoglucanase